MCLTYTKQKGAYLYSRESATLPSAEPLIKSMIREVKTVIQNLKLIVTTIIAVLTLNHGICQNNLIGVEMGMYNRGLIGLSCHKLFTFNETVMLSIGAGYGVGSTPFGKQINHFCFFTTGLGYSPRFFGGKFYLCTGADIKYLNYGQGVYNENLDDYVSNHFEGVGIMPFIGITSFEENIWFWQIRVSPLFLMNKFKIEDRMSGVGITIGKLI